MRARNLTTAFMLLLAATAASAQVNFVAPLAFEDSAPQQVLEADFNQNGRLDLLAVDLFSVTLFVNEGKGRFTAGRSLANSTSYRMASLGDFNKDGKTDIAVLNFESPGGAGSFFLLLSNGNGTFQTTAPVATQANPMVILTGDFNGDGKPDVAILGSSIQVFLGNGNGAFGAPQTTALPASPWDAVAADFNKDHKTDIAFGTLNTFSAYIYLSNGNGTFDAGPVLTLPDPATGLTAADVNGDGNPDLVASMGQTVGVLLGSGNGNFASPVTYALPRLASNTAVADVNGDGIADLIVGCAETDSAPGGAISVLLGNGNGTFQAAINSLLGVDVITLVAGDYTGNGKIDVAFTEDFSTDVTLGNGAGQFEQAPMYRTKENPQQVFAGNFLGTGAIDLVTIGNASLTLLPAEGKGTFGKPVASVVDYFFPAFGAEADFNGDGLPDMAVVGSHDVFGGVPDGLQVFFGQSGSNLAPGPAYSGLPFNVSAVVTGDINGDGNPDLLMMTAEPSNGYVVALGTGGGHFNFGSLVPVSVSAAAPALGDFIGNGKLDLILAAEDLYILPGNGDGTFQAPVSIPAPNAGFVAVAALDINRDGKLDIVAAGDQINEACVFLGNGDGTFQTATCYPTGDYPYAITSGDYNGDGNLDIATVNYNGDGVSVLLGNGDGTFQPAVGFAVGKFPTGITTADFNGDGKPDLAAANESSNSVSVLLNASKR